MAEDEKVYDLNINDHPTERGSSFRSVQVFMCWVCGAKTNKVVIGGWPPFMTGVRVICPCAAEDWHHDMEDVLMRLRSRILTRREREEVEQLSNELAYKHKDDLRDDLKGEYDLDQLRPVTNVRAT